ncbi:EAL domain-containing protein [Microbacterium hibisci]|uniref:EAL domain-containing protein n=1 Tax=Microbacterium hibisci TaxID=2036000 RepID=UPI0019441CA0|nr:EAL domain-containing protein [Microbacterium hibisci]
MVELAEMARALRGASSRGELSAWFQPQIDLQTNRLVAAEALCRWHHPAWGIVPPNEFIPIAEEDGTIGEIGVFMATQAMSAMTAWNIDISVNVSPAQLEDSGFTRWLERMIRRIRRPARRLTLEITEGRHLGDVPALVARLDRLRGLGVGIAIDDFGSGQASLLQARRLHATELKIDRALIGDDSPETTQVVAEAVELAHDAHLRVVAEGIETAEQLAKVTRLGCDRAQGYLLSRPVPRGDMARLAATA